MLVLLQMMAQADERERLLQLYEQYGNAMLRMAYRYFPKDRATAEDVVQTAWTKIIKNFSRIMQIPCKKQGAYLVMIVRNEAVTQLRRQRDLLPLEEELVGEWEDTRGVTDVSAAIRSLPDSYRVVLELRFLEERTAEEIAELLNMRLPAVHTRIHRGKNLLRAKLEEEGIL